MEVAWNKGDTVLLLYHPADSAADVGQQFALLEPSGDGLVAQVISNDTLEYSGLEQELVQRVLEERAARREVPLDRERGMAELGTSRSPPRRSASGCGTAGGWPGTGGSPRGTWRSRASAPPTCSATSCRPLRCP